MQKKPSGWLQVVCIIAIVLGGLGILAGFYGLARFAVGPALRGKFKLAQHQAFGTSSKQLEVQRELERKAQKIADRWKPVTIPLLILDVLVSGCLIAGGIGSLWLRPGGRMFLIGAFLAAIVLGLVQLVPSIGMQCENMSILEDYVPRMMEASAPPGQEMPHEIGVGFSSMFKVFIFLGIAVTLILKLAEVGFYVFGTIYLCRPNVRERFFPSPTFDPSETT